MKTCFLFGHRDAPERLLPAIEAAMIDCVEKRGVGEFVIGHYGGFDRLAARAGCGVKAKYPQIRLTLLLPYLPAANAGPELPPDFDSSLYPDGLEHVPRRFAIVRANRAMIDRSDCVIAYAAHPGNARNLLEYARSRKVHIANLADCPAERYNSQQIFSER